MVIVIVVTVVLVSLGLFRLFAWHIVGRLLDTIHGALSRFKR